MAFVYRAERKPVAFGAPTTGAEVRKGGTVPLPNCDQKSFCVPFVVCLHRPGALLRQRHGRGPQPGRGKKPMFKYMRGARAGVERPPRGVRGSCFRHERLSSTSALSGELRRSYHLLHRLTLPRQFPLLRPEQRWTCTHDVVPPLASFVLTNLLLMFDFCPRSAPAAMATTSPGHPHPGWAPRLSRRPLAAPRWAVAQLHCVCS